MLDGFDIVARLIGCFYTLGGLVGLRGMVMADLMDKMLLALKAEAEAPKALLRRYLLAAGAMLTALSGVALGFLNSWAVPLFALNLLAQIFWLLWARTAFPPEDEEDRRGRQQTTNAAFGYAAVTALVFWLWTRDQLGPWTDLPTLVALLAASALVLWVGRHMSWKAASPGNGWNFGDIDDEPPVVEQPKRLRVELKIGYWSLHDIDDGRNINPYHILPVELADRISTWEDAFADAPLGENGIDAHFATDTEAKLHRAEGEAIVRDLMAIYGDGNVQGPIYPER